MADNFRQNAGPEEAYKFDPIVHAVTVIQETHRLSHDGMLFHASGKVLDIANAASADFLMVVPAGCYPHVQRVRLDVEAGDVDLQMYEGITASDDGSPLPTFTTNRNSSNVACSVPTGGAVITDTGTLFHTHWIPPTSAGVGNTIGVLDVNAFGEEWILQPSTKYLFRITNNSGGVLDLRWEFVWYEVSYED